MGGGVLEKRRKEYEGVVVSQKRANSCKGSKESNKIEFCFFFFRIFSFFLEILEF